MPLKPEYSTVMFRKAARKTSTMLPEESARKYRKIVTEQPMAAVRSTGRRPIRSESRGGQRHGEHGQPDGDGVDGQDGGPVKTRGGGGVGQSEDREDGLHDGHDGHPDDAQHVGALELEHLLERHRGDLALFLCLFEDRGLIQVRPDPVGDAQHHDGEPERDAPAPAHHGFLRESGDRDEDQGGQHHAGGVAGHHEAGEEAALAFRGVFQREGGRARRTRRRRRSPGPGGRPPAGSAPRRRPVRRWAGIRCPARPGP